MVDKLQYLEREITQVEYVPSYEELDENDNFKPKGTFKYFDATEKLPIYVSKDGNLCTNMHTEVDEGVARVLMAFNDGQFDMAAADITDDNSVASSVLKNVVRVRAFLDKATFDALFPEMMKSPANDQLPFTTYYEFMNAIGKTPGFCGGVVGPMYSQMTANQMCAKELAGMFATLITATLPADIDFANLGTNSVTQEPLNIHECGLQIS